VTTTSGQVERKENDLFALLSAFCFLSVFSALDVSQSLFVESHKKYFFCCFGAFDSLGQRPEKKLAQVLYF